MHFMRAERLKLMGYRSYSRLDLAPGAGLNVLLGENAEGKTNAIEAIFLCAFGRSHRTTKDAELVNHAMDAAYVGLDVSTYAGPRKIEIKFRQGERKKVLLDGAPIPRMGELLGVCNVVMFSPEDLSLVKDGPEVRRRFLDMELSQLHNAYFYRLQQYNQALKQRNALLKEGAGAMGPGLLAMWDEQLASLGAGIMQARAEFIPELAERAERIHAEISGGREQLSVRYAPNVRAEEDAYQNILTSLERCAAEDLRRGFTGAGPHRDELELKLSGAPARTFGSQGQQRTAALALKLAVLALIKEKKSEAPILLLDDVLSELDDSRQQLLLSSIRGCQAFLTCTSLAALRDRELFDELTVFRVQDGDITSAEWESLP